MIITSYKNGNTQVTIHSDGTKVREYKETAIPVYPESIDIKITNYCDLGCSYCHESSTREGAHGDLERLSKVLNELPAGVEVAIGGGNPLSHPQLIEFLQRCKVQGLICNLTMNQGHINPYVNMIKYLIEDELIKGLGISITSKNYELIKPLKELSDNIVYHLIAGVNDAAVIDKLVELGKAKILVLGYKQFGFGVQYYSEELQSSTQQWYRQLPKYIGKVHLSFDNLAIEQLNIKRLLTEKGWEKFYMGDDFTFTMYMDAVNQQYSPTSRSNNRRKFNEYTLKEYFQQNRIK